MSSYAIQRSRAESTLFVHLESKSFLSCRRTTSACPERPDVSKLQARCCGSHGPRTRRDPMYLVREIMYCKPGKVRAMVDKFKAMSKLSEKVGMPKMRVMTDMCAERYWTIVSELEVSSLEEFENMMQNPQGSPEDLKQFEKLMEGYHDLVDYGKREIYRIEG